MPDLIRIFMVEDDARLRVEFEQMVRAQTSLSWLGGAGSLQDARSLIAEARPDVAIIDLGLPDGDGIDLIAELTLQTPRVLTLVSTVFGDEKRVIRAIEAGARGYLLKDSSPEEFVNAICVVHQGGAPLSPHIAKHLLARLVPSVRLASMRAHSTLTAREIEILTRIAQGFTTTETAEFLCMSVHTATSHIKNIYSKLAVSNRVQAVNHARSHGLID